MATKFDNTLMDLHEYIQERGFYYSLDQIYNFYVSLKTKPFVIITGISGSGKSKIVDLFAEYIGKVNDNNDNYEIVPVKPNWTDSRGLFGFHNIITETYEITPTLQLFLRANQNPEKPYFLILDEMNLAKVEYYFSDFLSLLESRKVCEINDHVMELIDEKLLKKFNKKMTLSHAIIISALTLPKDNQFRKISDFRETVAAKWWGRKYFHGEDKNWTPAFRTELNQTRPKDVLDPNGYKKDGSRLAGKAFFATKNANEYKLKSPFDMDDATRDEYQLLVDLISSSSIQQEQISLHSSNLPLKTNANEPDYSNSLVQGDNYYVPAKLEIPLNVFVIGTVNIDETTYMFSPKVLDRGNVLEFNDVDLYNAYGYGVNPNTPSSVENHELDMSIALATLDSTKTLIADYPQVFDIIAKIFHLLKTKNKHFGYRVINEISRFILIYVNQSKQSNEALQALDLQILQKVLPKLNGTEDELSSLLNKLFELCNTNSLLQSKTKIQRMIDQLDTTGYVTFIE
ncbi:McrB family protein [Leuconostoc falkenbergense]|uniref:McrB family protein n=1 Tax=Leuconostoc falkenbergense TaxID=2766470 RepID=UPI0024A7ECCC|nr:AAA family ATPase [Leuconostoc falkenbergense]MDI6553779.1 AAA family ATPase [Leuconostoc falkenbergense]